MTGLLGQPYGMARASYDLTRLRRNGLIVRIHAATCTGTADGLSFAIFYQGAQPSAQPLLAANAPQTPPPLRVALRTIDQHIDARLADARIPSAATSNSATNAKDLATKDR